MSDSFRVSVRCDGETRVLPLEELLAENEGSPAFCERVRQLGPGEAFSFGGGADVGLITVRRFSEGQRRRSSFRVAVVHKNKPTQATLTVDRVAGLVTVRLHRRRKVYEFRAADVVELLVDRGARADAGVGRLNARRRRVH